MCISLYNQLSQTYKPNPNTNMEKSHSRSERLRYWKPTSTVVLSASLKFGTRVACSCHPRNTLKAATGTASVWAAVTFGWILFPFRQLSLVKLGFWFQTKINVVCNPFAAPMTSQDVTGKKKKKKVYLVSFAFSTFAFSRLMSGGNCIRNTFCLGSERVNNKIHVLGLYFESFCMLDCTCCVWRKAAPLRLQFFGMLARDNHGAMTSRFK